MKIATHHLILCFSALPVEAVESFKSLLQRRSVHHNLYPSFSLYTFSAHFEPKARISLTEEASALEVHSRKRPTRLTIRLPTTCFCVPLLF